jgi:hypothetical protein
MTPDPRSSGASVSAEPDDLRRSPLGSWLSTDKWSWPLAPAWPVLHEAYIGVFRALSRSATQSSSEDPRIASIAFLQSIANDVAQLTSRAVAQDAASNKPRGSVADWPAAIARRYQDRSSAAEFLTSHPVLHERVRHILALHRTSLQRMLTRLRQDADDVRALCATPSIQLRRAIAMGDLHRRGSVLMVEFASGVRAMYKPRGLSIEIGLSPLLSHLASSDINARIALPISIDRRDYGWQRYVRSKPMEKDAPAGDFYRSMGGLVAVAHVFGGVDLHCDKRRLCRGCADRTRPRMLLQRASWTA